MDRKLKIDLTNTHVMDDDVMDEMENLEATAVLLDEDAELQPPDECLDPDDGQDIEGTTSLIKVER